MGSKWRETTLGDLSSDVSYGYTESASSEKVGPRFLRITDIQNGVVDWRTVPYCPSTEKNYEKYKLHQGDIVVARTGNSTGENYLFNSDEDAVYASYLIRFKIDDTRADSRFVWYTMRSANWWSYVNSSKTGSAQAGANAKVLGGYPVILPPLPEQRAIAHILGSLDDKIELNRRMNETLEAMAQALFKSWFIDFDPVIDNAILAGNPIPGEFAQRAEQRRAILAQNQPSPPAPLPGGEGRHYRGAEGLPNSIRQLFPCEFECTSPFGRGEGEGAAGIGWIPKGWRVESVEKTIEINPKIALKKNTVAPYVDMKALPTTGFSVAEVGEKEYTGGAKFNNGDVLLARITPCLENGKTAIVDFLTGDEIGAGSTEVIVLRGKGPIHTPFIACLSRSERFRLHCIQSMVGSSGRQRVQNACFTNFYISIPPTNELLDLFQNLTVFNFNKITNNSNQSRTLAILRDVLLPKLISGEIQVSDLEKYMERSV